MYRKIFIALMITAVMSCLAFAETDTRLMRTLRKPDVTAEDVKRVIADGADLNATDKDGYIPIIYAAGFRSTEIIRIVAEAGADIDVQGLHWAQKGRTALMETVVRFSDMDTIRLLISEKNINMADNDGMTALIEAAIHNSKAYVVKALIDAGSDVKKYGSRALMGAASWNCNPETARLLIEAGADVNIRTSDGKTPLMLAASAPSRMVDPEKAADFIRVLISEGADVNAKDKNGETALDFANNENIRKILRDAIK
ncbi:MAG: ankyrin repeat domain-containing protein [Synergistaceae bacterium]|nr:ankyrin repeat domain-containing protein [Synergistaceae bacterium]